ncbi:MAG: DUF3348 family protein [Ottowia sp.]|nr:DUF3348 family protein [Halieaceae bacterium]MCB2068832.1 DUF3348 family protein [Ottowia sp.]
MSQATTHFAAASPRLLRYLAELGLARPEVSRQHFTRRLGALFDLQDSIAIAAVHGGLGKPGPAALPATDVTSLFLAGRGAILRSAARAFDPDGGARIRFPGLDPADPAARATSMEVEPYLGFYRAQQSDAEHRVRRLQLQVREASAGRSAQLDQLCALDAVLARSMSARTRGFFSAIPRLLQTHFETLRASYRPQGTDEAEAAALWQQTLQRYRLDMRGMLLAEIETRLLPVTGLVEAVEAHQMKETHD